MAGYIGSKSSVTLVDGITKNGGTLEGDLSFGDNDKAKFGAGDDLQIYHNGSNSYIDDAGSGDLYVRASGNLRLTNSNGADTYAHFQESGYAKLYHNGSEKLATTSTGIDVTGSVTSDGLVVSAANANIDVSDTGTGVASQDFLTNSNAARTTIGVERSSGGGLFVGSSPYAAVFGSAGANLTQIASNNIVRMTVDTSGNVFVARTAEGDSNVGHTFRADGFSQTTRSGGLAADFNRLSTNGDILRFQKDGSSVGTIGSDAGKLFIDSAAGNLLMSTAGTRVASFDSARLYPLVDNSYDLGLGSYRFDDIFATNGTIQTSDFNEKQDIASLTATEMLVGKRISALFKTFRWKDSVAENGDNARTHTGVIAQDVQAAFTAEGLDAGDYALFISSTWWEHDVDVPAVEAVEAVEEVVDEDGNVTTEAVEAVEAVDAYTRTDTYDTEAEAPEGATSKTRLGIRYPELLSFVAAYNEQRFASIEARLTALEA